MIQTYAEYTRGLGLSVGTKGNPDMGSQYCCSVTMNACIHPDSVIVSAVAALQEPV